MATRGATSAPPTWTPAGCRPASAAGPSTPASGPFASPTAPTGSTWTGCTLQGPDGTWFTFYTGATLTPAGNVQSIGLATSDDLVTWDKQGQLLESDPRWYEKLSDGQWHDEAFRDPFVYRDGDRWRMLITANGISCSPAKMTG